MLYIVWNRSTIILSTCPSHRVFAGQLSPAELNGYVMKSEDQGRTD